MAEETVHSVSVRLDRGYEFLAAFDELPAVPAIRLDEPAPLGASNGPNAAALLAAAVGNCLAASLLFCLRKSRVDVAGIEAHVTARITRTENGRLRIGAIEVRVEPDVPSPDAQARLERCRDLFEDFCVVTQSVRRGIDVSVRVEPKRADAAIL